MSWVTFTSFDEVEEKGFLAGSETSGTKLYVGRVVDSFGNYLPVKIVPSTKKAYYADSEQEVEAETVEFLENVEGFSWELSDGGKVIDDAVGVSEFSFGRTFYNGNIVLGRIDSDFKQITGSFDGEAFNYPKYEVLVFKPKGKLTLFSIAFKNI